MMENEFDDFVEIIRHIKEQPPQSARTYVPSQTEAVLKARPDWPELEARMKAGYGPNWELMPYNEDA